MHMQVWHWIIKKLMKLINIQKKTGHPHENNFFQRLKMRLVNTLQRWMPQRKLIVSAYCIFTICAAALCFMLMGKDLLPHSNKTGQLQLRIKEPDGTRLEKTEHTVKGILNIIDSTVNGNVTISSAYVGIVPSSYGTSNLYVFNSGTHEAVVQVNLDKNYKTNIDDLKDKTAHKHQKEIS